MKLLHVEISNTGLAEFSAVLEARCDSTLETVALMDEEEEEEEEEKLRGLLQYTALMHVLQQR
jgi:hypothetical protein